MVNGDRDGLEVGQIYTLDADENLWNGVWSERAVAVYGLCTDHQSRWRFDMRYMRVLLWMCLVLFFPLPLAGCSDFSLIGADLEEVPRDASRADLVRGDALSSDAVLDVVVPDASFSQDVPLLSESDASSDALDVAALDDSALKMYPAVVLSPTTCHGRTLRLPDSFFQPGMLAWHFCYVTPDPREREDGGITPLRPASVCLQVGVHEAASLIPAVTASAPLTANPWTASVAVALPQTATVPQFNVRQDPPSGFSGVAWALDGDGGGGLRTRGTLRVWRVAPDGQQMEVALDRLFMMCGGGHVTQSMPTGIYVPQGLCPAFLRSCQSGPFHCS